MGRNLENISKQIEKEYGNYITLPIGIKNIDIYTIIQNILPEYHLYIFSKFCNKLNAEDYNMGLKYAYTKTKDINSKEAKIPVDQVLELFKEINKKLFMEEDYEDWCDLPEVITICDRLGGGKMYKTVVIEYSPKADDMAQKVEEKANEMLQDGYELVTMSITGTAKAILVFKKGLKKSFI